MAKHPATQGQRERFRRGNEARHLQEHSEHRAVLVDRSTSSIPVGQEHRQGYSPSTAGTTPHQVQSEFEAKFRPTPYAWGEQGRSGGEGAGGFGPGYVDQILNVLQETDRS